MKNRMLISAESQSFLMNMGILLNRMGFKVIPAGNGSEVLKIIKLCVPDVVMLDTQTAIMDGISVLKHIKEDKQTSNIPVIMVSSDSSSKTIEKCKNLGCLAYLLKPINIAKLHEIIQKSIYSLIGTSRRHLRASFIRKVVVTYNGIQHEHYAETLSEGGIYIRGLNPFPIGSEVEVTLPLKGKSSICLKGVVIYTKGLFGDVFKIPSGMAMEFKGLTTDEFKKLKDYVENLIAEDILDSQEETVIEK